MRVSSFSKIFDIDSDAAFDAMALEVFQYQYANNAVYRQFTNLVRKDAPVTAVSDIPFLPIQFFKTHKVVTGTAAAEQVFESSGTTGMVPSRHYVQDAGWYREGSIAAFERLYGPLNGYCVLALLPSYLERGASSLVYMVETFMQRSGHPLNGFFLHDHAALRQRLEQAEREGVRTLLIGVTYALLDFAAHYPVRLQHTIVMETGGMKGRSEELLRSEVHRRLKEAFGVREIHSEYGMTELLSQAYARSEGLFDCPPWMQVWCGEEDDPRALRKAVRAAATGILHVIDLANVDSCAFIATQDLCRLHPDGRFEVLGRADNSDVRGCSLLYL